ncbi:hypothetical protein VSH64_20335 [Amycolatopsis rhabdoformis]|uniref:DUF4333 domain-containing protein n=1 Tax=Amycolatopsis rhabdoformis TaxID=1448059 RepID=A0ABZ1IJ30_9PSEU|nr:hypothetical protein [Amycolatopsis rhabdoformis]WSE34407.1 hypothetical protein VSH64_20335 [Amycolatopsis rhabdoformis]
MDAHKFALAIATVAVLAVGAGGSVALAHTLDGPGAPRPAAAATVPAEPGRDVTLAEGQEARLTTRDLTVRYTRLVEDSRCPENVTCVWSGDAVVALELSQPGRGEQTRTQLHTARRGPQGITYAAAHVELVDVSRAGERVTLRVS